MLKKYLKLILCCGVVTVLLQINIISAEGSANEILRFFNSRDPRIINGTEATLNATRHQVSIRRRRNDGFFFGTGHICGGSLISDNVVLCAAHCFVNYTNPEPDGTYEPDSNYIVVMGNLDRFERNNNTLVFDILKIVKAVERFNLSTFDNDIVLIILDGKVPAKHPTVRPIILNDGTLKENTMCQATGWGNTEDGYPPDILRTVDVPIIDFADCRNKTEYGSAIHVGMICAGYLNGEKDACKGDSGGPLVCRGSQAGIVSWGTGCAEALHPGVYTDVAYYKNWILREVAKHNGTLPTFSGLSIGGGNSNSSNSSNSNNTGDGAFDGGDGVSSLSCSLVLVSLMLIFNYLFHQIGHILN